MGKMFRIWLEWDYGQDSAVFTSREAALVFLDSVAYRSRDEEWDEPYANGQSILTDGLASIIEIVVDPKGA